MNGGYDLEGAIYHQHSNKLLVKIMQLWADKEGPILDIGCGHNFYMSVMRLGGWDTWGMDSVKMNGVDFVYDVSKPLNRLHQVFDSSMRGDSRKTRVLSLEVGEHIPADLASVYLDNLVAFGGDVIMSWAVPGQAGHGHINNQTNDWVADQMAARGYSLDLFRTNELRIAVQQCHHCPWFRNTLMYFHPITEA